MENSQAAGRYRYLRKTIGPGLLFASSAIGTSHLVLSTRAGAHYGWVLLGVILLALCLKYPFYEFGPRYANATGHSLVKGYKAQGKWAVILFMVVIFINMFAVTGAIAAVCAGLISTILGIEMNMMPVLVGGIILFTTLILHAGGYSSLDKFIKILSVVLFFSVLIAFVAVLLKGTPERTVDFKARDILHGPGLALLISLMGWMPAGIEASTMNSIWTVEQIRASGYHPNLKESLFDFNLGYFFTLVIAVMFLIIGALTLYGTGKMLDGNATQFSTKLIQVFTTNIGSWAFPVIAIAAFGTIYGTLITIMDAFTRSFIRGLRAFRFEDILHNEEQQKFLDLSYRILLPILGTGGFLLFYFSASSMIKILEGATIIAFITAPLIALLNLRAIQGKEIPRSHRPPKSLLILAIFGLVAMTGFAIYYLFDLMN